MNSKVFCFLIFSLILNYGFVCPLTDEEYLNKSILRSIIDKKGQFKSEFTVMNAYSAGNITRNFTHNYTEKFDYKLNIGEFTRKFGNFEERFMYIDRNFTKEMYLISNHFNRFKDCHSFPNFFFYQNWLNLKYSFRINEIYNYTLAGKFSINSKNCFTN